MNELDLSVSGCTSPCLVPNLTSIVALNALIEHRIFERVSLKQFKVLLEHVGGHARPLTFQKSRGFYFIAKSLKIYATFEHQQRSTLDSKEQLHIQEFR